MPAMPGTGCDSTARENLDSLRLFRFSRAAGAAGSKASGRNGRPHRHRAGDAAGTVDVGRPPQLAGRSPVKPQ